jgi:exopolyphosphatase/guanosine-5'-triphosphate,3'-diphosphate pyrophosphatase
MRRGVVDVGSHTVRLEIADGDGRMPLPVHTAKKRLRLAEQVHEDGTLPDEAVQQITGAVQESLEEAERWGAVELFVLATAVVRDAPNREHVLKEVEAGTGVRMQTLPGPREAGLTFLAARRWMGWRAGPLAVLDIGGGALELAFGRSGVPDFAYSVPLGAGRLTRTFFGRQDPPPRSAVKALRRHVEHELRDVAARVRWEAPRTVVATSRTFQQLARLGGAAPMREGPFVHRTLTRAALKDAVAVLRDRPAAERAKLPGISRARSRQSLAGALVGHCATKLMGIEELTICPWALREGVLLERMETGTTEGWLLPSAS